MVEIERDEDGDIIEVRVGDERLGCNDPGWVLPKALIGDTAVNDLPEGSRLKSAAVFKRA